MFYNLRRLYLKSIKEVFNLLLEFLTDYLIFQQTALFYHRIFQVAYLPCLWFHLPFLSDDIALRFYWFFNKH